ncbi:BREX-1 system adenine-specific DNA-methyltransferase PglX [Roseateles sp.]|uniref:BREX-1 system adenine-specific DNA-methyltransferase PglX n=1 Tax=Roseateles sp. TaxID=1971397 RepID=UPI00392672C2
METTKLRRFAQYARRTLMELVEARLQLVLQPGSAARRENYEAIKKLEEAIKGSGEAQVIERVAYTWFNRFCALRFMDVNRFTRIGVVSPAEGQFQPEILAEAKMGHIDNETVPEKIRQQVFALLEGKFPSHDPQGEAYRLLVVAACNAFHRAMPFLFERIDDYTELLMPDDLLSGKSILAYTREAMTPDACEDVEVIGWLYQFYISEKKDAVFEGLKKGKKIEAESIPAATQLFTPHWIVRYLVENSLGRLWMLNRPSSRLAEKMDYYIKPEQQEADFLKISSPEEIKICDPACGSGHMLTYAFDLLYAIYEEEGVDAAEIPEKILTHNLYGIEIDERAGELAAFALTMKARAKQRRFFNKGIKPNICVLENVKFEEAELSEYMEFIGRDLFTAPLQTTLQQFEEADNFGSLIRPDVADVAEILRTLEAKDVSGQLFLSETHKKVLQALWQSDYLSPKYHVVIANPPYMGGKGMNGRLGAWLKDNYVDVRSDLFSAFIIRNTELAFSKGYLGIVSPYVWLFLSSYEKMREFLLARCSITSLVQLEYNAFEPACIPVCAFTLMNADSDLSGGFIRLSQFRGYDNQRVRTLEAISNPNCGWFYWAKASDFTGIIGKPIAYWISSNLRNLFISEKTVADFAHSKQGLATADNARFLRYWHEVPFGRVGYCQDSPRVEDVVVDKKWIPHQKGGTFRRWYGNNEWVVNWENDGAEIRAFGTENGGRPRSRVQNSDFFFRQGITWSDLTIAKYAGRFFSSGFIFDITGPALFPEINTSIWMLSAYVNSSVFQKFLDVSLAGMHYSNGVIANMPCLLSNWKVSAAEGISKRTIEESKYDWDSYETSWDFVTLSLLNPDFRQPSLMATYQKLRTHWREMTLEMQQLEEENNRIFIDAYGLQDELTPEVPLNEITLTCNPHYRYGGDKTEEEREALLLADTMRELVSYAVGCMLGRYSLDKPGLILANQGETLADYLAQVPQPSFPADDDNVIPVLDGDWFADDITLRFRQFLRVAFGEAHYDENLAFIEQALNVKGKRNYSLRDYFLSEFYADHVKRYKKRPIYWLFSSPKGSFSALIYMHRYRPDTVSVVLKYLRDYREKLSTEKERQASVSINPATSQGDKTRALKEVDRLAKVLTELEDYERDVLYPLATEQKTIDLDDGVKANYLKFGAALKKITGLDAKEED